MFGGLGAEGGAFELDRAGRAHHVADRRSVVVLPAPLAPSKRRQRALVEREGESVQGLDLAVIGAQILDV